MGGPAARREPGSVLQLDRLLDRRLVAGAVADGDGDLGLGLFALGDRLLDLLQRLFLELEFELQGSVCGHVAGRRPRRHGRLAAWEADARLTPCRRGLTGADL